MEAERGVSRWQAGADLRLRLRDAPTRPYRAAPDKPTSDASLLLQASVPPNVVQRRLGHKKIEITLGIYAHALPAMQQDAAAKLATLLH